MASVDLTFMRVVKSTRCAHSRSTHANTHVLMIMEVAPVVTVPASAMPSRSKLGWHSQPVQMKSVNFNLPTSHVYKCSAEWRQPPRSKRKLALRINLSCKAHARACRKIDNFKPLRKRVQSIPPVKPSSTS